MTDAPIPNDKEPVGTPAWRRFFAGLARNRPRSGAASFGGGAEVAVALHPPAVDTDYVVLLECPENRRFWVGSKTRSGFAVHADGATGATINYTVIGGSAWV